MKRICWMGFDKWASDKSIARLITDNIPGLSASMFRPGKKPFVFLQFNSDQDYQTFCEKGPELKYKNKKLKFKEANVGKALFGKYVPIEEKLLPKVPVVRAQTQPIGPIELKVTPLCQIPYQDQLNQKWDTVNKAFEQLSRNIKKVCRQKEIAEPIWYTEPYEINQIIGSPQINGYRNKTEFTIGFDSEGQPAVGFVNGQMSSRTIQIDNPQNCTNIPEQAKVVAEKLQSIIRSTDIPVYDIYNNQGIWKTLVYRCSDRTQQTMLCVLINPTDQQQQIEKLLFDNFQDLTTVALQIHPNEVKVLHGPGYITEIILDKTFKVQPNSFFQINTLQCDNLYKKVIEAVQGSVLLDVCCGTGTIGICASDRVEKVIGFEIIPEAVQDAQQNAELNNVQAEYYLGKAEDNIRQVIETYIHQNIFAVVDPPRGGLHQDILKVLRTTKGLDHLVYVSCNPATLCNDLAYLCGPEIRNKIRGPNFKILDIQPIDMFPHTPHVECVVKLIRSGSTQDNN